MSEPKECPACGGSGGFEREVILGYVSRDMATDAGDMQLEGYPVYGSESFMCELCEGTGLVDEDRAAEYEAHVKGYADENAH